MTWKDFKARVEELGVKDHDQICDISYNWHTSDPDDMTATRATVKGAKDPNAGWIIDAE